MSGKPIWYWDTNLTTTGWKGAIDNVLALLAPRPAETVAE
jgi:hypothetical protein